jgi:hypothetical protein
MEGRGGLCLAAKYEDPYHELNELIMYATNRKLAVPIQWVVLSGSWPLYRRRQSPSPSWNTEAYLLNIFAQKEFLSSPDSDDNLRTRVPIILNRRI